ncbi:hypothetical protein PPL_01121 [Heterostelium album PN500]|uniref:Uncharacterized protein n=1 Tax=Heterostelium pallidum (strain ATCC 26659 / Pp 5 / PN500) TaxID=670386 RepID=D3AY62_HETP5|nr:hypothetical protein PPL_01121 [Heterostelium album PN500]EFA85889.1 hypothetical protein PPL_01121 [Heterostelium album PN500]|eukprot:XP_020437995.1 hypothetical protein PPL_01121 [Heterostelium album PN500]
MAQQSLKVKKNTSNKQTKQSKVGINKKSKSKSPLEIAKKKISKKLEINIANKIESEMKARVTKNNGKLSVLKSEQPKQKRVKKNH